MNTKFCVGDRVLIHSYHSMPAIVIEITRKELHPSELALFVGSNSNPEDYRILYRCIAKDGTNSIAYEMEMELIDE